MKTRFMNFYELSPVTENGRIRRPPKTGGLAGRGGVDS